MEALPHMHNLLNSRPDGFNNLEEAIEWQYVHMLYTYVVGDEVMFFISVTNHTILNPTSARISVPSLFVPSSSNKPPNFVWRTPLRSTAPYWESKLPDWDTFTVGAHPCCRLVPRPIKEFPRGSYSQVIGFGRNG